MLTPSLSISFKTGKELFFQLTARKVLNRVRQKRVNVDPVTMTAETKRLRAMLGVSTVLHFEKEVKGLGEA